MAFDPVLVGTTANDGTGDPLRTAFTRVNSNFGLAVEGPAVATDGAVALYDSTTGKLLKDGPVPAAASGLATLDAASRVLQGHSLRHPGRNNHYLNPPGVSVSTSAVALNVLRFTPVIIPGFTRFNGVGVEVTVAAAAGGICRLGLYRPRSDGDLDLIVDFGSVETDTTGVKTISNNFDLNPGVYFAAAVAQVQSATYRAVATTGVYISSDFWTANLQAAGVVTGVTGALPSTSAVNIGNSLTAILIRLRLRVP